MRAKLGIKSIIVPLFMILALFGCFPEIKRELSVPEPEVVSPALLPISIIDKKIEHINGVLESKGLDEKDRKLALDLLSAYKTIRSASQSPASPYEYREIVRTLFNNLSQIDERYFLKEKHDDETYSKVIKLFTLKKREVLDKYLTGNYQGVINDCIEMEALFGPESLTPEIGLLFAVSLGKKKMLNEAIHISEKIIREMEGKPDLIHLRASLMGWHLDMGDREKALQTYEKLVDNLDEKEAILDSAKKRVTKEEIKTAHHENIPRMDYPSHGNEFSEKEPMKRLLMEVDRLVQNHAFTEAKLLLIKQRLRTQEESTIETIDQALKSVDITEERYEKEGKTPVSPVSPERETLELATKLIEEENFEEAITKLNEIQEEHENYPETKKLKELAIERLINRERNKAAKIFLKAKNTDDAETKKELLVSSYNILKSLIEKYPSSNLLEKLKDNLKTVEEELNKLREETG